MKRILLDVDGVIADFIARYLHEVNSRLLSDFTHEHIVGDIEEVLDIDHIKDEIRWEICQPNWCFSIPVIEGALHFVENLNKLGKVVILTSNMTTPNWTYERTNWLKEHFGILREDVIFAKSKFLVGGDYLIDDLPENCIKWSEEHPNGVACLMDQPWNQECKETKNLLRFKSYEEIIDFLTIDI